MAVYAQLTPVFVVTGFLGSGKTTLLNHMLRHPALKNAAVLVNEFGDVGLDHHLVQKIDENTVLLASGCICCTIRGDLTDAVFDLHRRRAAGEIPAFERLLIETTGLADPAPILFTLMSQPALRHHYRLGTVITTVDAVNGAEQMDRQEEAVKQTAVADRIVLTKTDLAETPVVADLKRRIDAINPSAEMITARFGELDVSALLRADVYDPSTKGADVERWLAVEAESRHDHGSTQSRSRHDAHIHTFSMNFDEPLDWTAFGIWLTMLIHRHGQDVLRIKGLLNVKGAGAPVLINAVQHVVHPPMHLGAWPDADRRSRLVFIVRDLDRARIEASLAAFNRIGAEAA